MKWTEAELVKTAEIMGKPMTPAQMRLFARDLEERGFDDKACAQAIAAVRGESRFFPTIAEVIAKLRVSSDDAARAAWTRVWAAVKCASLRGAVDADERTRQAVKLMGGWGRLSGVLEADEPWERKRFVESYEQAARADVRVGLTQGEAAAALERM